MEPGKKKLTQNPFEKPYHETTYKKINKKKEVNKASIDIESKINAEFNAIKKENQDFLKAAIESFSYAIKKDFKEIIKSTVKELSTVIKNENKELLDSFKKENKELLKSIDKRIEKRDKHLEDLIKANNENISKIVENSKNSSNNSNDTMIKILSNFNDEEIKILSKRYKRNSINISRLFPNKNSSYNPKKKEKITPGKRIKTVKLPNLNKFTEKSASFQQSKYKAYKNYSKK